MQALILSRAYARQAECLCMPLPRFGLSASTARFSYVPDLPVAQTSAACGSRGSCITALPQVLCVCEQECHGSIEMSAHAFGQPSAGFSARGVLACTTRVIPPVAILGMTLVVAACASQSQDRPTGTASLALQSKAPVWGGDTQPAVTDVVRVAITPQQAREIARACRDAPTELPASGSSSCEDEMQKVIRLARVPCNHSVCLEVQRTAGQATRPPVMVKITDGQPGAPLCHSAPGHLCFQLGAQAPVARVLTSGQSATPSPTDDPTPTASAAPTATSSPSLTGSASPSPTESTSSTTPNPATTGTPSPTGTGS